MMKRMKKLYRKNKSKDKHTLNADSTYQTSHDDDGINNNNNHHSNNKYLKKLSTLSNRRSDSVPDFCSHQNKDSTKESSKKNKNRKEILQNDKAQFSKSTSDLLHMCNQQRHAPNRKPERARSMHQSYSRSSITSIENVRENRLSAISQLDEYIDRFKKSVDEESIAYAPNRICCAQILKMVYQKREQQYIYNSLHPSNHRQSTFGNHRSSTAGDFQSLGRHNSDRKVRWQQGSDSESSSISDELSGCSDSFDHENGNDIIKNEDNHNDSDSQSDDEDFSNNSKHDSHRMLHEGMKQRSMPLFPQNIDIY